MTTEQTSREDKLFVRLVNAGVVRLPTRLAEWEVWLDSAEDYLRELETLAERAERGARDLATLAG